MASGPIVGDGDGSREKQRWPENTKVYTRRARKSAPASPQQTLATVDTTGDGTAPPADHDQRDRARDARELEPEASNCILNGKGKHEEAFERRRKLTSELDQVRGLIKKVEARELQLGLSQISLMSAKRGPPKSEVASGPPHVQLSVSVPPGLAAESSVEKRTPKANQFYRNSEFILANDRLPTESYKKQKLNGNKKQENGLQAMKKKLYRHVFKSCGSLLTNLMKHKFGWVFNTPVDVKALGLHDYYSIIHHPMDLGTIKTRLAKNWYKSPEEFAEDVRLTFHNAMTYNPKGQDVHFMAEQLSQIFEENWPSIEFELTKFYHTPAPKKIQHFETRNLERSGSTLYPVVADSKVKSRNIVPHSSRPSALKKPKAKDANKREMTLEEKQKLSNNLQNLPPEKLDATVAIIRKKNLSMSQHDDEIEIDMDNIDTETLWELDRLVTNYKKWLSKYKRKAKLAVLKRAAAEQQNIQGTMQGMTHHDLAMNVPKESRADVEENNTASSVPIGGGNKEDATSKSNNSSSSSSDSGSSSDSDSESSSTYESDAVDPHRT